MQTTFATPLRPQKQNRNNEVPTHCGGFSSPPSGSDHVVFSRLDMVFLLVPDTSGNLIIFGSDMVVPAGFFLLHLLLHLNSHSSRPTQALAEQCCIDGGRFLAAMSP